MLTFGIGLLWGRGLPVHAQQQDGGAPPDPLLEERHALQRQVETLREQGRPEAARRLEKVLRQRSSGSEIGRGVSGDYTEFPQMQSFVASDNPNPQLNFDLTGMPRRAGDVDGDGTDDYVYRTSSARDERTSELGDDTTKTALFFGGSSPPQTPDQLLYRNLRPVGDLDGDDRADAVRFDGNTLRLYEGTSSGYSDSGAAVTADSLQPRVVGFTDLDNDDFGDLLLVGEGESNFQAVYGASSFGSVTLRTYTTTSSGDAFSYNAADSSGNGQPPIVRLAQAPDESNFRVQVFEIDLGDRSLTQEQDFAAEEISGGSTKLIDITGDGEGELFVSQSGNPAYVFAPNSDSTFTETPVVFQKDDARPIGDLNDDGNHDFYVFDEGTGTRYVAYGPDNLSDGLSFDTEIQYAENVVGAPDIGGPYGGLGDLTGDGIDDAVLGYFDYSGKPFQVGRRFVEGSSGSSIGLTTVSYPRTYFFDRVAATANVGDVNADGTEDFAAVFTDRGTVGVYFGGETISETPDVSLTTDGGTFPVHAAGGDFNGDGTSDVVVPFDGGGISGTSKTAVFHGGGGFDGSADQTLSFADAAPSEWIESDGFQRVVNAGDVNDDGTSDLLASAPFAVNEGGEYVNEVYLYYGGSSLPATPNTTINYRDSLDTGFTGWGAITGIGDFNDDGTDDFAVSLSNAPNEGGSAWGRVHAFFGGSNPSFSEADLTIRPRLFEGFLFGFSYSLSGGRDVNGDGTPDLIASVPFRSGTEADHLVSVYHGGQSVQGSEAQASHEDLTRPDARLHAPVDAMGPNAEDSDTDGDGLVDENFGTLTLADLNQDGASEVTLGTNSSNTNALVYRGSDPVPQNPYAVYSAPNAQVGLGGVRRVAMGNFTGNRRIDAVFTQVDDNNDAALSSRFYRFEGPDPGRFGPEQQIAALEEDVSLNVRDIADLDGNGTQDVVADAYVSEDSLELRWYANDGTGAFAEQLPIHTFVSEEGEFGGVRVADLDGDGDQDVVWSADDLNKVAWHSNQGDGTFGPTQVISTAAPEAENLAVGDIDGDSTPDVVNRQSIIGEEDIGLAWYPNQLGTPGADEDGFGVRRIITNDYRAERRLRLADLDRDGTLDVLFTTEYGDQGGGDDRIRWFRNLGGGTFGDLQVIAVGNRDAESVRPADLNRDGNYDVLASGAVVGWYRNEGDGVFDTQSLIGSSPDEDPSLYSAAGDANADGTMDLVTAEISGSDRIAWRTGAGSGEFGDPQLISTATRDPFDPETIDLDGDGDYDIFVRAGGESVPAWYENLETTAPSSPSGLTASATDSGVDLSWSSVSGASGYNVYRALRPFRNPAAAIKVNDSPIGGTSYTDASGAGGQRFYYRITTVAGGGESTPSNPADAVLTNVSASQTASVSSDGTVDFGSTGISVNFVNTQGSGTVEVTKFGNPPAGTSSIDGRNASTYRFEAHVEEGLAFGSSTEIRIDASSVEGVTDPTSVAIYKRSAPGQETFTKLATTYDEGSDELVAQVSSLGEFALGSDTNPLPVELASFEATTDEGRLHLAWQTSSETNNARFEVQRRVKEQATETPSGWSTVGSVETKAEGGTTTKAHSYQYIDSDLPYEAGRVEYRLRQVDMDGTASLSRVVTVERRVDEVELLGTYPNPARGQITVRYALPETQSVTIRLYDVLGRKVRTLAQGASSGRQKATVDVSGLPSGSYFLRLRVENGPTKTRKLTIVR